MSSKKINFVFILFVLPMIAMQFDPLDEQSPLWMPLLKIYDDEVLYAERKKDPNTKITQFYAQLTKKRTLTLTIDHTIQEEDESGNFIKSCYNGFITHESQLQEILDHDRARHYVLEIACWLNQKEYEKNKK